MAERLQKCPNSRGDLLCPILRFKRGAMCSSVYTEECGRLLLRDDEEPTYKDYMELTESELKRLREQGIS